MTRVIGGSRLKNRRLFMGIMVAVLLGASAAAMPAQELQMFAMGGGASLFDKRYYTVYGASYGSTYRTGGSVTVGAEIPLTKMLSVEGSYGITRNNLAVTDFYNSSVPNSETTYPIRNQRVSLDAVAHAPKAFGRLRPYLVAGLELDHYDPTSAATSLANSSSPGFNGIPNTALKADNKFGINFGGGIDVKLMRRFALRLDLRDHVTGSPTFGLPSEASSVYTAYYPIGGHLHGVQYSAGIVFHFGK